MRKHLLFLFLITAGLSVNGQDSIPNGNFESWTQGVYYFPLHYPITSNPQSFFRTLTPFSLTRTTDAYHGSYAVQLTTTISSHADTAFAYLVPVQPSQDLPSAWHGGIPYNLKPRGIRGYYKYNLESADSGAILVAFSRGGKNLMTYVNQIGGLQDTYKLFEFDFTPALSDIGLLNDDIRGLAIDPQGIKWVGTYGGGAAKYDGSRWTSFTTANGLPGDTINSIYIDPNGNKWFGTTSGASKYTGVTWATVDTSSGLSCNDVRGILVDQDGNEWFSTFGGGVSMYNGSSWTHYTTSDGLASNYVRMIRSDNKGNKWFATTAGVSEYNDTGWITYSTTDGLANNDVRQVLVDQKGVKWFATFGGGVSRYNDTVWTNYTTSNGLASNNVFKIGIDPQSNLWFATDAGVSRFDGLNWTTYTRINGLASDTVRSIGFDLLGNKWFGTQGAGISKFDGVKWKTINNYTTTTPDSVIFAAISCKFTANTQNPKPAAEGSLILDSISFTGVNAQPDYLNGDFENWLSQSLNKPDSWQYYGDDWGTGLYKTTDKEEGNYAVELKTYLTINNNTLYAQPAILTNGYFDNSCGCMRGGFPFSNQTDTLLFYYKYMPAGNDSAVLALQLRSNGSNIYNGYTILHTTATYQFMEVPFSANSIPDTAVITMQSSHWNNTDASFAGSDLIIDGLLFKSQSANSLVPGFSNWNNLKIYPNPTSGKFRIENPGSDIGKVDIFDIQGKMVYTSSTFKSGTIKEVDISGFTQGIYFLKIYGTNRVHYQKLIVQ